MKRRILLSGRTRSLEVEAWDFTEESKGYKVGSREAKFRKRTSWRLVLEEDE